ncbi:protein shisa-4-like [Oncorhynchus clarkii lewisi]|uniref:protein shisa-4-like n=1 Tax=Oncorhynchus clarkii lewisi TaxID=490388 RepID=UPI0039B995F0
MAKSLSLVTVILCGTLIPFVTAGEDCEAYLNAFSHYKAKLDCSTFQWCCGTCENRYCCSSPSLRLTESEQENCIYSGNMSTLTISSFVATAVIFTISLVCCCVCPCCCLYKMCRKPRPVIATTAHTTVVNTHYPQQPVQPYQGAPQYPAYQTVPVQPGYGVQPQPGYGGGQPIPTAPGYQGQPFQPGPPPPYQETGPAYPPAIPVSYSQAGFSPGQLSYPLQAPAQPSYPAQPQPTYPCAPPAQPDFLSAQPAYNPAFMEPQPPKTGN